MPLAPLTVLRAPGGAGKTVLAAQLADRLPDARGLWVTVDEHISTRDAFWRTVMDGFLGRDAAGYWISASDSIQTRRLVEAFRSVAVDSVIVVDDSHMLKDASVADDILEIVRAVPTIDFIVASRASIPRLEDAAVRLTIDVRVLTVDDLSFSLDEVVELVGGRPSSEHLLEKSGGNALFLRALTLTASHAGTSGDGPDESRVVASHLRAYLAQLDDSTRHFLLRTSLGGGFTLAEAAALVGPGDRSKTIRRLEVDGLLTRIDDGDVERYRYHPVVSEVLQGELEREYPGNIADLHAIIARTRRNENNLPAALTHALLARDYTLASEVLVRGGTVLLRSGAQTLVMRVPLPVALHHPMLATGRALVENARGRRWVAREFFAAAVIGSRAGGQRVTPEKASMAVAESMIARLDGNTRQSVVAARRALRMIDRLGEEVFGDQVAELMVTCAVSFFRAGEWAELEEIMDRMPRGKRRGGLMHASLAAARAALRGEWDVLEEVDEELQATGWPEFVLDEYSGVLLRLAKMVRALGSGDVADARVNLAAVNRHLDTIEFKPLLIALDAIADVISGDAETAISKINRVRASELASRRLSPMDADQLTLVEALACAAAGDLVVAARLSDKVDSPVAHIVRAQIVLLQQDAPAAAKALANPSLTSSTSPRMVRMRQLLLAWCMLESGERDEAKRALLRVVGIGRIAGEDGGMMLLPQDVRDRMRMLFDGDRSEFAAQALSQLSAPIPAPFFVHEQQPQLSKRELAVVHELRHGHSNAQIAQALNISRNTVKTQLRTAYQKLGVTSRDDALAKIAVLGLSAPAAD
ncbi:LuxR C-terminal-related transcriptional regulator [Microbacterium sp. A588]